MYARVFLPTFYLSSNVTRYWMVTPVLNICVHTSTYTIVSFIINYNVTYVFLNTYVYYLLCPNLLFRKYPAKHLSLFLVPTRTVARCWFHKESFVSLRSMLVSQKNPIFSSASCGTFLSATKPVKSLNMKYFALSYLLRAFIGLLN